MIQGAKDVVKKSKELKPPPFIFPINQSKWLSFPSKITAVGTTVMGDVTRAVALGHFRRMLRRRE